MATRRASDLAGPVRTSRGRAVQALEDDTLRAVIDLCRYRGLVTAHFRPARTADGGWRTAVQGDGKGWPDLFILNPVPGGAFMWREVKRDGEKPTPEQAAWLAWLAGAGANVKVWYTADLRSGLIVAELDALRRVRGVVL